MNVKSDHRALPGGGLFATRGVHRNVHVRRSIYTRRGFSLAEVMIAIGILGVGMLMVASTFPVGIDQARIVSEQSLAPVIANEAFAALDLMLRESDTSLRIGPEADPTNYTSSFRQSIINTEWLTNSSDLLRAAAGTLTPANADTIARDINNWLGQDPPAGLGTRFYPASPEGKTSPNFTWSVVARSYVAGSFRFVAFTVFVNRGSNMKPVLIRAKADSVNPNRLAFPIEILDTRDPSWNGGTGTAIRELSTSDFAAGAILVGAGAAFGNRFQIVSVDTDVASTTNSRVVLDRNPGTIYFWHVPPDPATGRSPLIGVFTRTFRY